MSTMRGVALFATLLLHLLLCCDAARVGVGAGAITARAASDAPELVNRLHLAGEPRPPRSRLWCQITGPEKKTNANRHERGGQHRRAGGEIPPTPQGRSCLNANRRHSEVPMVGLAVPVVGQRERGVYAGMHGCTGTTQHGTTAGRGHMYLFFWSAALSIISVGGVGVASVVRAGGGLCPHGARASSHRRWLRSAMVGLAVVSSGEVGVSATTCGEGGECRCQVVIPTLDPLKITKITGDAYPSCSVSELSAGTCGVCNQGSIPSDAIGKLVNLNTLFFGKTALSGTLPSGIGKLGKLTQFWLYSTKVSGTIPPAIGGLVKLTSMDFNNVRKLSGSIPKELRVLAWLRSLNLAETNIEGPLPSVGPPRLTYCQLNKTYNSGMTGAYTTQSCTSTCTDDFSDYTCCGDTGPGSIKGASLPACGFGLSSFACGNRYLCPKGSEGRALAPLDWRLCSGLSTFITQASRQGVCGKCPSGKFKAKDETNSDKASDCAFCPPGTYSTSGATECQKCPSGTYNPLSGGVSLLSCVPCLPGKYGLNSGGIDSAACIDCSPGRFGNTSGVDATCFLCSTLPGSATYQDLRGQLSCKSSTCGAGLYSIATTVTKPPTCDSCPAGKYSSATGLTDVTQCNSCPPGKAGNNANPVTSSDHCVNCNAGKFADEAAQIACKTCTSGTSGSGQSLCLPCDAGTKYDTTTNTCIDCTAGYYSRAKAIKCEPCEAGTVQVGSRQSTCTSCTGGKYGTEIGQSTDSCKPCGRGKFSSAIGASESTTCNACIPGKWLDEQGKKASTDCKLCKAGQYGNVSGAMSESAGCFECKLERSEYTDQDGQPSCTSGACLAGDYGTMIDTTSRPTCYPCPAGTYSGATGLTDKTQCNKCVLGKWYDIPGAKASSLCKLCPAGKVGTMSGAPNVSSCSECNPGLGYTDQAGQVSCKPSFCPVGTYGVAAQGEGVVGKPNCSACPPGTYSSAIGLKNKDECTKCPSGRWGNKTNATTINACTMCAAGKHSSMADGGETNRSVCAPCGVGTYSPPGAATCTACPEARFGATTELTSLNCSGTCPAGWYCPLGTSAPEACGVNTFFTAIVAKDTTCLACPTHALCAGANSVVNLPGFWPLYNTSRPDELNKCTQATDAVMCFQACLSPDACLGASGLKRSPNLPKPTVTAMPTRREWLTRYNGLPPLPMTRGSTDQTAWSPANVCNDGYGGLLCGNCTRVANHTYVRDGPKCRQCPEPVVAWAATVIAMVVVVALGVFLVHKTVNKRIRGADDAVAQRGGNDSGISDSIFNDRDVRSVSEDGISEGNLYHGYHASVSMTSRTAAMTATDNRDLLLPILRQLLSFCSLLGKVGSFRVGSIRAFRTVMHTATEAASGVGVGSFWMTCAFQWDFYQRFVLVAVLPVLVVLLCISGVRIGFFRASWQTMCRVWTTASDKLVDPRECRIRCFLDASIVYCLYMAFPTVTEQLFHALKCTEVRFVVDGGNVSASVLTADFRVSCLQNTKYDAVQGVGGGLVALYVLAPPVVLAWWIRRNREHLADEMSMRRFGFLYRGYRLDAFPWWGSVSLLSKVAVTAIVVFVEQELVQMVAALLVFSVLILLQMAAKPFKTAMLNNLQVFAYVALAVTQFVPIFISVTRTANLQDREQQLDEAAALPVSIGLIAVNCVVVLAYVVCAWKERGTAVAKARLKVERGCAGLRRCFCCFSGGGKRGGETGGSLGEVLLGGVHLSNRALPQEEKSPGTDGELCESAVE